jgi:hypothetical protein
MMGRLVLAALGGLAIGAAGMGMARDYLEPKHTSLAQCIVDEARGLSKDIAVMAIYACREQFPTATLPDLKPKAALPDDLVDPAP